MASSTFCSLNSYPLVLLLLASLLNTLASAACECGYTTTITGSEAVAAASGVTTRYTFTDRLESDFTPPSCDIASDRSWARQAFNLTNTRARGPFGEMFAVDSTQDGTHGLDLTVRAQSVDGMVPVAEVDTKRLDVWHGTFRAVMKLSPESGTCAAFFWYFNDTQEIDMEFLSAQFDATSPSFPVNLVLQSREAAEKGYDASATGDFVKLNLPFDPTADFHEYRFDYLPGRVLFYADGQLLREMRGTAAVPTEAGHLILQHWSNGNAGWSGGPPAQDAVLTVRSVRAYFNSSSEARQREFGDGCVDPEAEGAVCQIAAYEAETGDGDGDGDGDSGFVGGDGDGSETAPGGNGTEGSGSGGGASTGGATRRTGRDVLRWPVATSVLLAGGWALGVW